MHTVIQSRGQSMIELLVAIAIFSVIIFSVGFLVLDTYIFNREAEERTQAVFFASEGIEAVRSIRDRSWALIPASDGNYCVGIVSGRWVFTGSAPCAVAEKFTRTITISADSFDPSNKKIVTSTVTWDAGEGDSRTVSFPTFITNWRE